jgi:CHAD domain-containing protein
LAGVRWGNAIFMAETLQREHIFRLDDALPLRNPGPAQRAVAEYLSAQIDGTVAGDAGLRYGADPIHDTRVAIRRVRSTLRVFAKLFDDHGAASELESDLKWFAALLGEVRDCQVQGGRFEAALDRLPDELILGPVRSDIRNTLRSVEGPARGRVTEAMDSARYLGMMAVLGRWQTEPPLDEGSDLDDLRKCVKKARRKAKAHKKVQSALGDHQDTVVARDVLRRMAAGTGPAQGENGFTYGLQYAREQRIARESRLKARKLAEKGHS